jgi:manganese transport protein
MAGGTGKNGERPFFMKDSHSRAGIFITLIGALVVIFFLSDPFNGLIWSQIVLSMQLPVTIFSLLFLTSSTKVMGKFVNSSLNTALNWIIGIVVAVLNVMLLRDIFWR